MTFSITRPYLASTDSRRFNRDQTRAQQQATLSSLTMTLRERSGLCGQLPQLLEAIENRGETIPGRTAEESLQMVDMTIGNRLADVQDRSNDRSIVNAIRWLVAMVAVGWFFLLLNFDPFNRWFIDALIILNGF